MAIQANGKIVAVGEDGDGEFALARYNPDGSLDPSFSGDGKQTTAITGFTADEANAVVLQADGKIVAVGGSRVEEFGDFALARYNPDGSLDPSFSGDGKQEPNLGFPDFANGAAIQADGKIIAVGLAGGELDSQDFALARLNVDGSLDASFSGDGEQRTEFGGFGARTEWRSRRTARSSRSASLTAGQRARLRARPLQPERLARPELFRRRQAEDQLRGLRRCERGGDPGGRQDRRGRTHLRYQ